MVDLPTTTREIGQSRAASVLEIAKRRGAHAVQLPDGSWQALRRQGTHHVATSSLTFSSPEEALEALEADILAGEARDKETKASRLLAALSRAVYYVQPQEVAQGPNRGTIEWVLLRTSDRERVGDPFPGLLPALFELARLVGEPAE